MKYPTNSLKNVTTSLLENINPMKAVENVVGKTVESAQAIKAMFGDKDVSSQVKRKKKKTAKKMTANRPSSIFESMGPSGPGRPLKTDKIKVSGRSPSKIHSMPASISEMIESEKIIKGGKKRGRPKGSKNKPGHKAGRPSAKKGPGRPKKK